MKALIQRVSHSKVEVDSKIVGEINQGLLVFIGIEKQDEKSQIDKMIKRLLSYRVFYDANDKMNLSVSDIKGGILAVSQFTLAADTNSGTRPGFSTAKKKKKHCTIILWRKYHNSTPMYKVESLVLICRYHLPMMGRSLFY